MNGTLVTVETEDQAIMKAATVTLPCQLLTHDLRNYDKRKCLKWTDINTKHIVQLVVSISHHVISYQSKHLRVQMSKVSQNYATQQENVLPRRPLCTVSSFGKFAMVDLSLFI